MKTVPTAHPCRFVSAPEQPLPGRVAAALPLRRAYARLPLWKTGTCTSLIVLTTRGQITGGEQGKHRITGGISFDVVGHQH